MSQQNNTFTDTGYGLPTPGQSMYSNTSRKNTGNNGRRPTFPLLGDPEEELVIYEDPGEVDAQNSIVSYPGYGNSRADEPVQSIRSPPHAPRHMPSRNSSSDYNYNNHNGYNNPSYAGYPPQPEPQLGAYYQYPQNPAQAQAYAQGLPMSPAGGNLYAGKLTIHGESSVLQGNLYNGANPPNNMSRNLYLGDVELARGNKANFMQGDANTEDLSEFWNGSTRQRKPYGVRQAQQQVPRNKRGR